MLHPLRINYAEGSGQFSLVTPSEIHRTTPSNLFGALSGVEVDNARSA